MRAIVNANIVLENEILENSALLFGETIEAVAPEHVPEGIEIIDGGTVCYGVMTITNAQCYCARRCSRGRPTRRVHRREAVEGRREGVSPDGRDRAAACGRGRARRGARDDGQGQGREGARRAQGGVFISVEKKGAHNPNLILPPDTDFLAPYADILRIVITAPEKYPEFVQWCAERGIVAAMGHTNATYQEAMEGIRRGVTQATHLFNGMRGLTHREPGAAGAALLSDRVNCELIADTAHVAKELYPLVYRMKGPDKILLITDSSIASGMGPGVYTSNARTVYVDELVGRLENGTISSSVVPLRRDILNFHRHSGATLPEAVRMATLNPARVLKLDHALGSIREGKRADLFVADGEMNVLLTVLDGEIVYRGDAPC